MKDISDALDLIATARDALLNDLLPKLQKDQRYTALMIANALAIAQREQRASIDVTRDEIGRLVNLFAECGIEAVPSGSDSATNELPGFDARCAARFVAADSTMPRIGQHWSRTSSGRPQTGWRSPIPRHCEQTGQQAR